MLLKGKVALVTGAARGIGKAVVLTLADHGANVAVNDIKISHDDEVVKKLREKEAQTLVLPADVGKEEDVKRMFEELMEKWGRLDILVNNAGITRDALLHKLELKEWEKVIKVNLTGTFLCTRAAAAIMAQQKSGKIINFSSAVALLGNIGQANYTAAKAGIIGLTRTVARELAGKGINVNAVAPGFINTDMTATIPLEIKEKMIAMIPMKRAGQPEDVARVVLFLASPLSDYVTGQVIPVDGGIVMD